MKQLRILIPFLGALALLAMFLKLPETPNIFSLLGCKSCSISSDPYLPLVGAGYFATLISISLLFPTFPNRQIARGGILWAVLLAIGLTYMNLPGWCLDCLIAHACNIAIWSIWLLTPTKEAPTGPLRERLCITLFAPISVMALFSCLNLTFLAYGFKIPQNYSVTTLQPGDVVPHFKDAIVNFVSPNCPYCKEQLAVLNELKDKLGNYQLVNLTPRLLPELIALAPELEWMEDKEGALRELFKVSGYPTLFVIDNEGKIKEVIQGVPEQLQDQLISQLM